MTLKFERIGDTDLFDLYFDGKKVKSEITMDEVLACISKKESEEKPND